MSHEKTLVEVPVLLSKIVYALQNSFGKEIAWRVVGILLSCLTLFDFWQKKYRVDFCKPQAC